MILNISDQNCNWYIEH